VQWRKELESTIKPHLLQAEHLSFLEMDLLFSMLPSGDFHCLGIGSAARTKENQLVTILGYSSTYNANIGSASPEDIAKVKMSMQLQQEN